MNIEDVALTYFATSVPCSRSTFCQV